MTLQDLIRLGATIDDFSGEVHLSLLSRGIDDHCLSAIAALQYDELHLTLRDTSLSPAGLVKLVQLPRIAAIHLLDSSAESIVEFLESAPQTLRAVSLTGEGVTEACLNDLNRLCQVEDLRLTGATIGLSTIIQLKEFANLEWLQLDHTNMTDELLSAMGEIESLTTLVLSHTAITGRGFHPANRFGRLRALHLQSTNVDNEGLREVGTIHSIVSLVLSDTSITNAGVRHLCELSALSYLDLRRTLVDAQGIYQLSGLPSLRSYDFDPRLVDRKDLMRFRFCKSHCRENAWRNQFILDGGKFELDTVNRQVHALYEDRIIDSNSTEVLCQILEKYGVTDVSFKNSDIQNDDLSELATLLAANVPKGQTASINLMGATISPFAIDSIQRSNPSIEIVI